MPALEVDSSDACAPYPDLEIAIWGSVPSGRGLYGSERSEVEQRAAGDLVLAWWSDLAALAS
jgi:hypothetical protein